MILPKKKKTSHVQLDITPTSSDCLSSLTHSLESLEVNEDDYRSTEDEHEIENHMEISDSDEPDLISYEHQSTNKKHSPPNITNNIQHTNKLANKRISVEKQKIATVHTTKKPSIIKKDSKEKNETKRTLQTKT